MIVLAGVGACARPRAPAPVPDAIRVPPPEWPAPTPPPIPTPPETGVLWIAAVGDIQLGEDVPEDPERGPLSRAAPWLSGADLALGNLEGPLTTEAPVKCARASRFCFAFTTPPHAAEHLARVGFGALSLANNHALDAGEPGRAETIRALEAAGVRAAAGFEPTTLLVPARSPGAPARRVAVLGFATASHSPDLRDPEHVETLVRRAAAAHDLVIVFFHGGAEGPDAVRVPHGRETYVGEDRGDLRAFARRAVDAGADLVLGSGPHVLRGLELYRDRLIAYSLANFAGGGKLNTRGIRAHTGVLQVCLDAATGRFLAGRWVPFLLDEAGVPHPDPGGAAVETVRTLSLLDFWETVPAVESDGALTPADGPTSAERCGASPGRL